MLDSKHQSRFGNTLIAASVLIGLGLAAPIKVSAQNRAPAKNVMLFIADGASWGTWDMASYWEYGQLGMQPYDSFDVKLGMTTTPLNTSRKPTNNNIPMVSYDPAKAWDTTPNANAVDLSISDPF